MAAWSGRLDPGRVEDIPGQANLLIAQFARNAPAAPDGRTVIGQGLQHSGMFWSLRGAIIASRCGQLSGHFDDFRDDAAGNPAFLSGPGTDPSHRKIAGQAVLPRSRTRSMLRP